jgi:hypothetical protein
MQEKNHFHEPNPHMLTFLHPIVMCRVTYWAPVGMLLRSIALDVSKWREALESYEITLCNNCCFSSLCTPSPPDLSNNCSAYHLRHIIVLSQLPSSLKKKWCPYDTILKKSLWAKWVFCLFGQIPNLSWTWTFFYR